MVGAYEDQAEQARMFAELLEAGAEDGGLPVRVLYPTETEASKLFTFSQD